MIEEAFVRQDWDDTTAQQQRDQLAELLQSQGYFAGSELSWLFYLININVLTEMK